MRLFSNVISTVCIAGAMTLFGGCAGSGKTGSNVRDTDAPAEKAAPVLEQPVVEMPARQLLLIDNKQDLLRLSLIPDGGSEDERKLAGEIVQLTRNAVSSGDARIIDGGDSDVRLTIRPKLKTVDQDLDYYRMNCDLVVELKSVNSGRVFGSNTFKLISQRRVLGKDAAVSQFEEPAANETSEWCRAELKRIAADELGVTVLTIQLPSAPKGETRRQDKDSSMINTLGDNLRKLPDVVSCRLVGQDAENGTCMFRTVYFKSSYPNGIMNEVSARIKELASNK